MRRSEKRRPDMIRQPGSLSLLARLALGASMIGCAGVGPPVVEHPRSGSMTAVAPESDPLAGAVTFRPGEQAIPRPIARASTRVATALALPVHSDLAAIHHARVILDVGAWNLALAEDEAQAAPDLAFSEAMSLSSGPAPRLDDPSSDLAVLHVSEAAVEEGAWEASRR
jgi:hypothetical protein